MKSPEPYPLYDLVSGSIVCIRDDVRYSTDFKSPQLGISTYLKYMYPQTLTDTLFSIKAPSPPKQKGPLTDCTFVDTTLLLNKPLP